MSISQPTKRKHRFDTVAPRVRRPMSRRLAIEAMESRVMLSGTELDTSLFNLDSIAADFAVISSADYLSPFSGLDSVYSAVPLAAGSNGNLVTGSVSLNLDLNVDRWLSSGTPINRSFTLDVGRIDDNPTLDQANGTAVAGRNAVKIVAEGEGAVASVLVERSLPGLLDEAIEVLVDSARSDELASTEGGMIPIGPLVAVLENRPFDAVHDQDDIAASSRRPIVGLESGPVRRATAELSGELARAVAFEMIEAESAPLARATVDASDRVIAAAEASPPQPVAQRSQAFGPIQLAWFASLAADRVDVRLAADAVTEDAVELLAGEAIGRDRGEVFSDWARPSAERVAPFGLSSLLVVVAMERFVFAKDKREQQIASPPKPARRSRRDPVLRSKSSVLPVS